MDLVLRKLGDVIAKCWDRAEEKTKQAVSEKYPAPAEEQVTFLFGGELRSTISRASDRDDFSRAFVEDIESRFPGASANASSRLSGLIAQVNIHSRWHEGHYSAADMGIVISRPSVILTGVDRIQIVRTRSQGLLAQAKLGKGPTRSGKMRWGSLTYKQTKLIPTHKPYYALLLYRLSGNPKTALAKFGWQFCGDHTVREVQDWLRDGKFPCEMRSAEVIKKLSIGSVGTGRAVCNRALH